MIPLLFGTIVFSGTDIGIPLMFFGSLVSLLGFQLVTLGLYAKIYAIHTGFEKHDKLIDWIAKRLPLEKGILLGLSIIALACAVAAFLLYRIFSVELGLAVINYSLLLERQIT